MGLLKCLRETAKRLVRRTNKGSGHERQFNCHKYNGASYASLPLPCSGPKRKWQRQRQRQRQSPGWLVKCLIHLKAIPRTLMLWHCMFSACVCVYVCVLFNPFFLSLQNATAFLYHYIYIPFTRLIGLIRSIFSFE